MLDVSDNVRIGYAHATVNKIAVHRLIGRANAEYRDKRSNQIDSVLVLLRYQDSLVLQYNNRLVNTANGRRRSVRHVHQNGDGGTSF